MLTAATCFIHVSNARRLPGESPPTRLERHPKDGGPTGTRTRDLRRDSSFRPPSGRVGGHRCEHPSPLARVSRVAVGRCTPVSSDTNLIRPQRRALAVGLPGGLARGDSRMRGACPRQDRVPVPRPGEVPRVIRGRPERRAGCVRGRLAVAVGGDGLGGTISEPAWRSKPSWYLVTTEDRMIPPPAQREMSARANSTVVEVAGSHAIYVLQPAARSPQPAARSPRPLPMSSGRRSTRRFLPRSAHSVPNWRSAARRSWQHSSGRGMKARPRPEVCQGQSGAILVENPAVCAASRGQNWWIVDRRESHTDLTRNLGVPPTRRPDRRGGQHCPPRRD